MRRGKAGVGGGVWIWVVRFDMEVAEDLRDIKAG